MPEIIWKKINAYINYSISTDGNVRNDTTNRILKYYIRNGYKSITLSENNVKKTFNIHSIVAETFLLKPASNYVVNHINENKLDNNLTNLEYVTPRDNVMHSMTSTRSKNDNSFNLSEFTDIPNYSAYMVSKNGDVYSKNINRLCCVVTLPSGYLKIKLKSDAGEYKDLYIHIIVAMTYMNYTPTKEYVINHIDCNKSNNNLCNLEIITPKENMKHSVKMNNHRLFRRGVYYINEDNEEINFVSAKEASIKTGIDNSSILKSCKSEDKKAGNIKWYLKSNS
jgi:hypothetical protein